MKYLLVLLALAFCSCGNSQDFNAIDGPTLFAIPTATPIIFEFRAEARNGQT